MSALSLVHSLVQRALALVPSPEAVAVRSLLQPGVPSGRSARFAATAFGAALLAAAVLSPSPARADSSGAEIFAHMVREWRQGAQRGYDFGTHYGFFMTALSEGAIAEEGFSVQAGKNYRFAAVADDDARDLSLSVQVNGAQLVAGSGGSSASRTLTFQARRTGRVFVRIRLNSARGGAALAGILAMEQNSGPRGTAEMDRWDNRVLSVMGDLGKNIQSFGDSSISALPPRLAAGRPVPWLFYLLRVSGRTAIVTDPTNWGHSPVRVQVVAESTSPVTLAVLDSDNNLIGGAPKASQHLTTVQARGLPIRVGLDRSTGDSTAFVILAVRRGGDDD